MLRKLTLLPLCIIVCHLLYSQKNKCEFRAAWIATVENIDWPSQKGLPSDTQKAEFIRLLDKLQENGLNAVIVQIRPAADAFYPSTYEPWSEYLTGVQGKAPVPYYDPLNFMIEETHKRCMEFHAWFNPYRAVFNTVSSSICSDHCTKNFKQWFVTYGNKIGGYKKYFDPGNPEARKFVTDVISDVVKRYDIDAVHFDDYFYPYHIPGKEFPDDASYAKYGNGLSRADWRRSNCDSIIVMLNRAIKEIKPYVKFGISPFGVWRNKNKDPEGSNTIAGQTNYDDLYADILLWLKNGWIDYVAPQCYWEIGFKKADYEELVDWWAKHNYGKHIYIGHALYRAGTNTAWRNRHELPDQIKMLRSYETIQGSCFFSSKNIYKNVNGWSDSLKKNYYNTIALIPPMKWIDSIAPSSPLAIKSGRNIIIQKNNEKKQIKMFVVYALLNSNNPNPANPATILKTFPDSKELILDEAFFSKYPANKYGISVVDRNNNESNIVLLPL